MYIIDCTSSRQVGQPFSANAMWLRFWIYQPMPKPWYLPHQLSAKSVEYSFVIEVWAKRGPPLFHFSVGYGLSAIQVFRHELVLFFVRFGWNCGHVYFIPSCRGCRCLFFDSAIYRGSLFCDRNAKMGPDRATLHLESWNLVGRQLGIFLNFIMVFAS